MFLFDVTPVLGRLVQQGPLAPTLASINLLPCEWNGCLRAPLGGAFALQGKAKFGSINLLAYERNGESCALTPPRQGSAPKRADSQEARLAV